MSTRPFYDEATNLYWILKGRIEQGIPEQPQLGQPFTLEKAAIFHYPIGQVLLVCDDDFEATAYAKVIAYKHRDGVTRVSAKIVKTLDDQERLELSNHLQTVGKLVKEHHD
jgi:hypothetical protein